MTGQVKEEQERDFRQERCEHWNLMLVGTNDEHERTRFFIDSRLENLYDRLDALERRVTREMREHAETTRIWLISLKVLVGILVVLLVFGTIWRSQSPNPNDPQPTTRLRGLRQAGAKGYRDL